MSCCSYEYRGVLTKGLFDEIKLPWVWSKRLMAKLAQRFAQRFRREIFYGPYCGRMWAEETGGGEESDGMEGDDGTVDPRCVVFVNHKSRFE